jgi:methionyl-tRNA formyltransferase
VRIVFWGTPDFAIPSLRALLGEGFDVVAVVTQPDRPHGRSRSSLVPPPVKAVALEEGLPVLQPESPSHVEFVAALSTIEHDLGVVVAYGHILKRHILDLPPQGMVNVHASLLPLLRGAAPIEHAILEGHTETGVTIMQMAEQMDAGPIIHQVSTPIAPDETGGELTVRLAEIGALALVEGLALLTANSAELRQQDDSAATFAPKLTRELAHIRWTETADIVARHARAFDPRPGSWTSHKGKELKLFGPRLADGFGSDGAPGQVIETDPAFVVATGDGALQFLDVQPAGRPRMAATDWVRGRGAMTGDRLE